MDRNLGFALYLNYFLVAMVTKLLNCRTELVLLYDYKAQAPDDLSVKRGDWVYADLEGQTVEGYTI